LCIATAGISLNTDVGSFPGNATSANEAMQVSQVPQAAKALHISREVDSLSKKTHTSQPQKCKSREARFGNYKKRVQFKVGLKWLEKFGSFTIQPVQLL
jgi:hypothetical protein